MSTKSTTMTINGMSIEIVRKKIKNLHVGVYPPNGRVRVAAPVHLSDEAVRLAVVTRIRWIRKQQQRFADQSRQSEREMVSGESHYFEGRRYRLRIEEADAPPKVESRPGGMLLFRVRPGTSREKREAILYEWYRSELKKRIPLLVSEWEPRVGVHAKETRTKRMRTRWGSCNIEEQRIWLNVELMKKPPACLEYVLVHELMHLKERNHTERFRELMDRHLPTWRQRRDQLNSAPLAHETWEY
ncbi:MAG: M48 family metallopeptidase [Spirochaetota bacterium]